MATSPLDCNNCRGIPATQLRSSSLFSNCARCYCLIVDCVTTVTLPAESPETPVPAPTIIDDRVQVRLCAACATKNNQCRRCGHPHDRETTPLIDPKTPLDLPFKLKKMMHTCPSCERLPLVRASRGRYASHCVHCKTKLKTCTYTICIKCSANYDRCAVCQGSLQFRR